MHLPRLPPAKELKQREQQLFLDNMELNEQIKKLMDETGLTAEIKRQFIIKVGENQNEYRKNRKLI